MCMINQKYTCLLFTQIKCILMYVIKQFIKTLVITNNSSLLDKINSQNISFIFARSHIILRSLLKRCKVISELFCLQSAATN